MHGRWARTGKPCSACSAIRPTRLASMPDMRWRGAGEAAIEGLAEAIRREDGPHIGEKREGEQAIDHIPNEERIARNAAADLIEIGTTAVPALLSLLDEG